MRLNILKCDELLSKLIASGQSFIFQIDSEGFKRLGLKDHFHFSGKEIDDFESFEQLYSLCERYRTKIIFIDKTEGLSSEILGLFARFSRETDRPYRFLLASPSLGSAAKILNGVPLLSLKAPILEEKVLLESDSVSLRTLLLKFFEHLPNKEDKLLLDQHKTIVKALYKEALSLSEDLLVPFIELLDAWLKSSKTSIYGLWLARNLKWRMYSYLRQVRQHRPAS